MVTEIIAAFGARIGKLEWMAPQTKVAARAKLKTLYVGVGYPETWRDYSGLQIVAGDAYGNAWRAEAFEYARNLAKLGHPVDRTEWSMTPQTVNAVNMPLQNALNFPAAYLQAPHFDPAAPAASNFGQIGSVIGHEISHSFDDQGSQFDASGRMVNWWTPQDFDHFKSSSAALIAEFDAYKPFPDLHVNGKLTLSENIADVAGLSAAYDAYRLSLGGKTAPQGRWALGGSAVLSRLRSRLARQAARAGGPPADRHRQPRPRRIPRRHGAQPRCLVCGLQGEAVAGALSRARQTRADVVAHPRLSTGG